MSPLGSIFNSRLRKFPSLVNCCTLDWFTEWPEEALKNVARGSYIEEAEGLGKDFPGVVEMFKCIHQSVEHISARFLNELRRRNYVTPTSFLELLSAYKKILKERQDFFFKAKSRLEKGLRVLLEAAVEVANLQESLEAKKPKLAETQIQVEKTKVIIERDTKEADATKVIVAAEEADAAEQEAEVTKVKNDADSDLAVALPMLDEAIKKVKSMQVSDLVELKAVLTPSMTIVKIFEMVYFMLKDIKNLSKPKKPNDPKKKEYDPDGYFDLAKREILNNPKDFLSQMIDYERDSIPDSLIQKINPMLEKEEVSEKKVQTASLALLPVRIWIKAMSTYNEVLKIVNPKRAIAAEMSAKLEIVQAKLNEKRESVRQINEKLASLNANMES
jgi:dynein heavy chain